jgi:hypothetical protein
LVGFIEDFAKDNDVKELKSDVIITVLPFFEKRGYKIV